MGRTPNAEHVLTAIQTKAISEERNRRMSTLLPVSSVSSTSSIRSDPSPRHSHTLDKPLLAGGMKEPWPSFYNMSYSTLHSISNWTGEASETPLFLRANSCVYKDKPSLSTLSLAYGKEQIKADEPVTYQLPPGKEKSHHKRELTEEEMTILGKEDGLFMNCEPLDKTIPISSMQAIQTLTESPAVNHAMSFHEQSTQSPSAGVSPILGCLYLPVLVEDKWEDKLILLTKSFIQIMQTPTGFELFRHIDYRSLQPPILNNSIQVRMIPIM